MVKELCQILGPTLESLKTLGEAQSQSDCILLEVSGTEYADWDAILTI